MKSGPFTSLIAKNYRIPETTVRVYMRWLREAGLITQGLSGRGAPDMTALDAARITIALLATDRPARAVEFLQKFGSLTLERRPDEPQEISSFYKDVAYAPDLEEICQHFFEHQTPIAMMKSLEVCPQKSEAVCRFRLGSANFTLAYSEMLKDKEDYSPLGKISRHSFEYMDMIEIVRGIHQ